MKKNPLFLVFLLACLLVLGGGLFAMSNPGGFVKAASLKQGVFPPPDIVLQGPPLDVAEFLGPIPYVQPLQTLPTVHPPTRYRKTILEGRGNCANLIQGMAYYLKRQGIPYQVIHMLPHEGLMKGRGHVVLRMPIQLGSEPPFLGIVDILVGGLPQRNGRVLDVADLTSGPLPDVSLISLNANHDEYTGRYDRPLAEMTLGYTPSEALNRYQDFIERIYLPLGNESLEKYVYDTIALLLGVYPPITVASIADTLQQYPGYWHGVQTALWMVRIGLILMLGLLFHRLFRTGRKKPPKHQNHIERATML